jgi:YHS domain-containing protein
MRRSILLSAVVGVAMMAGLALAGCQEKPAANPADSAKATASGAAKEIAQKLCPVTGEEIDPSIYVDYQGKRVYFCCSKCVADFEADPAKYLAKMEEQMKSPPPAKPSTTATPSPGEASAAGYWTCPMHPQIHEAQAGKCRICKMALVWKAAEPAPTGSAE